MGWNVMGIISRYFLLWVGHQERIAGYAVMDRNTADEDEGRMG